MIDSIFSRSTLASLLACGEKKGGLIKNTIHGVGFSGTAVTIWGGVVKTTSVKLNAGETCAGIVPR